MKKENCGVGRGTRVDGVQIGGWWQEARDEVLFEHKKGEEVT
jgi:hypothetical protein